MIKLSLLKKKHKGAVGIVFSMFALIFILVVMLYVFQYKINMQISQHIEDSISASTLSVLLPELDINAITKNTIIGEPGTKFVYFKDVLGTNLGVDEPFGNENKAFKDNPYYNAAGSADSYIYIENFTIYNIHNAAYKDDASKQGFADIDVYSYGRNALTLTDLERYAPGCMVEVRSSNYSDDGYVGTVIGCRYDYTTAPGCVNYKNSGVSITEYAKLLKSKNLYEGTERQDYMSDITTLKGLVSPEGVPITKTAIYSNITVPVKLFDMDFFEDNRELYTYSHKEQTVFLEPDFRQGVVDFKTL